MFATLENDIAFARLKTPFKFNNFVNFIPVPIRGREFTGKRPRILTWGTYIDQHWELKLDIILN